MKAKSFYTYIILLLLIICGCVPGTYAQEKWSLFYPFKGKTELIYGIDNRRTHIYNHNTLIYGLYTGVGFADKLRFKIGVSGTPTERGKFIDEEGLSIKNRLLFVNIGEEFDYFIRGRYRLTSYLQVGAGYNFFRKLNDSDLEVESGRNLIIPIEIGTHGNYDLNSWARLKVGGGWRFVEPEVSRSLSGYYIKLGIGVDGDKFLDWYRKDKPWFDLRE